MKSFDRENYQDKKFSKVSVYIHDHFIKAEKLLAFNNPIMDLAIYGACFAIAYFGALMIIKSTNSRRFNYLSYLCHDDYDVFNDDYYGLCLYHYC